MALTLDLSTDYLIFDGRESVDCYPAVPPQTDDVWTEGTKQTIVDARFEKTTARELEPSAGVVVVADNRVRLPAVVCTAASYRPAIGDLIVRADSSVWTMVQVGDPRFNNSWTLIVLNLSINGGLCDTISFFQVSFINVGGSKVSAHNAMATNVPARIQSLTAEEVLFQERLGFDVNFRVTTITDLDAKLGDLIQDQSGVYYEIKSWANRRRIDQLPNYLCKRRP